jgi:hypothetical protein
LVGDNRIAPYSNCLGIFQHGGGPVNAKSAAWNHHAKKVLLQKVISLLKELGIRSVLDGGDLLAYTRNRTIYHDDDLDLRYSNNDVDKLVSYGETLSNLKLHPELLVDLNRRIVFDRRIVNATQMLYNGVQVWLACSSTAQDNLGRPPDSSMWELHADIVPATPGLKSPVWADVSRNLANTVESTYLGVNVLVPNRKEAERYLATRYGKGFMKDPCEKVGHCSGIELGHQCLSNQAGAMVQNLGWYDLLVPGVRRHLDAKAAHSSGGGNTPISLGEIIGPVAGKDMCPWT